MSLRDYQIEAVNGARKAVSQKKNPVVVIPTGGGKTHVGVSICRGAIDRGNRVLWIAHRKELIDQAIERLDLFGLESGPIMAGLKEKREASVQVASIQTLVRRSAPEAQVVIVDEAHHARAETYGKILDLYPGVPVVGLTATPVRLDGKGLGRPTGIFDEIVSPISARALIERGFLMAPRYFAPSQPSFSGVRKVGGEFDQGQTAAIMAKPQIVGDVVRTILERHDGRLGVIFAASISNSKVLVERLREAGLEAAHLDGTTAKKERETILADLRRGAIQVVSNVGVLTEGWDLPHLGFVSLARPTASWALHNQMIGRVLRAADGKTTPEVFDHAGNVVRHGFPEDDVEFDLGDAPTKKGEVSKAKVCRACFGVVPVHVRVCPLCGAEFPRIEREGPLEVGGRLTEVKPPKPTAEQKARFYDRHLTIARELGYRQGFAFKKYLARYGVRPRGPWYAPLVKKHLEACRHVQLEGGVCRFCRKAPAI